MVAVQEFHIYGILVESLWTVRTVFTVHLFSRRCNSNHSCLCMWYLSFSYSSLFQCHFI